jgi:RNA polymerase sigma-70 factor (ECF subfamily)
MMTFEEVYSRFKKPVWRLARRLTESDEEALDATQEIFLRVWRGLGGFRGEAKLSTWLFQIAWNYLRGYRRSKGRQPFFVAGESEEGKTLIEMVPDPAPLAEQRAHAMDLLGRVEGAMMELNEIYRVILWLRDGEDLSYQEISTVLDIPVGTVRSRLARARIALKEAVER